MKQLGRQSCPARLMAGSEPRSVVAMEVFVEQQVVPPMGIMLKLLIVAEYGALAIIIRQED